MELKEYFPIWDDLTAKQQKTLSDHITYWTAKKCTSVHNSTTDCTGLLLIKKGQLRAYILSDEGKEITLYRLLDRDICLFSASCIMQSIQFDIMIDAEKDTDFLLIPADLYKKVMNESAPLANYTNEIMAARFSDVMWLIEQIMWKSFDQRLAQFLLEESSLNESLILNITHETIGKHLGSPREVVTRMLRYFQNEGMIKLSRGKIEITDKQKLLEVGDHS